MMNIMKTLATKVTERGQASIPASIRESMGLLPGSILAWSIADGGKAILVMPMPPMRPRARSARDMIGYGRKFHAPRRTADWMRELRDGEEK
jgi:AbrB family looped-hinge helix DNA binding protein